MHPRPLLSSFTLLAAIAAQAGAGESAAQAAQLAQLRAGVPEVRAQIDERLGVASHVTSLQGVLLPHDGALMAAAARLGKASADGLLPVRTFLDTYPDLCGGRSDILADAVVSRDASDAHNGLRTVVWQQVIAGIPVYHGLLRAQLTRKGDLLTIGSRFANPGAIAAQRPDLAKRAADSGADARAALTIAVRASGDALESTPVGDATAAVGTENRHRLRASRVQGDADARLVWFPVAADAVALAWKLEFYARHDGRLYEVVVDVADGVVQVRRCLTVEGPGKPGKGAAGNAGLVAMVEPAAASAATAAPAASVAAVALSATYRVYTGESPTPFSPAYPSPSSTHTQPPEVARALVTLTSIDATASPDGWVGAAGETLGNNVDAHTDRNSDNAPDLPRPRGTGSPLLFDFPASLTAEPTTYSAAAVVNLFYWCNVIHDRFYVLGFTEAFGNFQSDNFGRGGLGNDAIQADAQDGGGTNNANFSTPSDGSPGRMQMYLWNGTTPGRDGDFDASIIVHEYTHGLSNRLVGGGVGLSALQSRGMGEGWSDFYAQCLLANPGADLRGTYPMGGYVMNGLVADNYYYGIRRYPYVSDVGPVTPTSRNPLTFVDLRANPQVHAMGEVWCQTLWEARANLISRRGGSVGNQLILQLVTDGMKLAPANPTFLQARDAILQADQVLSGGANQTDLWNAFAKRGMGYSAGSASSDTTSDVVEAFDIPGDLRVTGVNLIAKGSPGGPFVPANTTYTIRNASASTLAWTAVADRPWISVSPAGGSLVANATASVTVAINAQAATLAEGAYSGSVAFTNTTSHSGDQTRGVAVTVASNYSLRTTPIAWIDPSTHANLALSDDSVSPAQALPFAFTFYGRPYTTVHVSSNGMLGFGSAEGLTSYSNAALPTAGAPNAVVYALWDDLNPATAGAVRFAVTGTAPNRKAVASWVGVPTFTNASSLYTVQVVLSEGSRDILVNYQQVSPGTTYGSGIGATIGIENEAGTIAQQHSFNTASLSNGLALLYHVASGTGLQGAYFANQNLTGAPALVRTDARVDFSWGSASPAPTLPADHFSVRWTGALEPRASENLTLTARTDDGVRVWLDGVLVIDAWVNRGPADSHHTFAAVAGRKYGIRMEYFENAGGAVATLDWSSASIPRQRVPAIQLYPEFIGTGTGLMGAYFANKTLTGSPAVIRNDAQVDFVWGAGSPAPGIPVDLFSAQWTGAIEATRSENLTLIARSDDGVRVWLDGTLVIDAWVQRGPTDSTYTFAAQAGRKYAFRMEYFENAGGAVAQLLWSSPGISRQVVPRSQLYPVAPAVALRVPAGHLDWMSDHLTGIMTTSAPARPSRGSDPVQALP